MPTVYEQVLATRDDMTEWLIHFTRDTDGVDGRQILLKIMREGVLKPGFARRGAAARATIYGPNPAVCFTEQPIAAFIKYVAVRCPQNAMRPFGILIHKHDVYAAGGLPVIYGLSASAELQPGDEGYRADRRMLRPSDLPFDEQFRYLAFAPNRETDPIDWTHEREWRWPATDMLQDQPAGLPLGQMFAGGRGMFHGRVHALVETDADILWLRTQIMASHAAGQLGIGQPDLGNRYHQMWPTMLHNARTISLETAARELAAGNLAYARFETWPEKDKHWIFR